jgi:hypothetical protein
VSSYNYRNEGRSYRVCEGAMRALESRGWERGVENAHEGEIGICVFEFDVDGPSHYLALRFGPDETWPVIGYPPEMLEAVQPAKEGGKKEERDGKA